MNDKYLVFDIENNSEYANYGRKAGNFKYDRIVACGFNYIGTVTATYYVDNMLLPINWLVNVDLLIGHNLCHDLLFVWEEVQDFLQRGGKIWDTQIAEYYLSSFHNTYPALRDIAVNNYSCTDRIKHLDNLLFNKTPKKLAKLGISLSDYIKKTYKQYLTIFKGISEEDIKNYKQVSDLPKELVLEDVQNDVLDTEQVFLAQYAECQRLDILAVVELQMDALLYTIEAEYNGFKVDRERLEANRLELLKTLTRTEQELDNIVAQHWK